MSAAPSIDSVRFVRRIWVPGVQYGQETAAQSQAREARMRAHDELLDALEARARLVRATPHWLLHLLPSFADRGSVAPSRGCGHAADSGAAHETATQSVSLAGGAA